MRNGFGAGVVVGRCRLLSRRQQQSRTFASVAGTLPAGVVGVSPAGVTTRVDAPAESTEEEYYQACHAARLWMDAQPGSGESLIEPYLAVVQASPSGVAGSWHIRWAALTPARQAAVIVAARAAANAECG
ncbi:putative lipoprotein LPQV [Mycobacterium tuberculosis]|nr:putative lipoprotein LPQV [Mycobacterium tuberculosis]